MQATAFLHYLLALPRKNKRLFMIAADSLLLTIAFWLAFALKFGEIAPPLLSQLWYMLPIYAGLSIPIFIHFGLYRKIIRYVDGEGILAIFKAVSTSVVTVSFALHFVDFLNAGLTSLPRSITINYWFSLLVLLTASRLSVRWLYQSMAGLRRYEHKVAIYGAGATGAQLATALQQAGDMEPVVIFDDRDDLQGSELRGIPIYAPSQLEKVVPKMGVTKIIIAMPSAPRPRRQQIVAQLERLRLHVMTVPNIVDIARGDKRVNDLREVGVSDLLGRAAVEPDDDLLGGSITGKVVMVTGAGGSIGSELCRQIALRKPRQLILFEWTEYALYNVSQELKKLNQDDDFIVSVLGNVQDEKALSRVFTSYQVDTVYHAAAFKHVPIVESHPIEGIRNNIFGTLETAKEAMAHQVERFVLVSTDKAVRPTNVMGATKRFSEIILQALAQQKGHNTTFCMVRFGNVLDSSGSVVPLFRKQIEQGGPVTVTHKDVIRYFMTIPEAAQLVLQAGSMAKGGEVFLLDMGAPIKIYELAKKMVRLSGLTIKDETNPFGDIRIEFTGLRPGEKLYEELLIDDNAVGTSNPRIMKELQKPINAEWLFDKVTRLKRACNDSDDTSSIHLLTQVVDGFEYKGPLTFTASLGGDENRLFLEESKEEDVSREKAVH